MIINVSWIAFNDFCFELQPVSWVAELKSVLNFSMTSLDRLFNGSIEWTHNLNDFLKIMLFYRVFFSFVACSLSKFG